MRTYAYQVLTYPGHDLIFGGFGDIGRHTIDGYPLTVGSKFKHEGSTYMVRSSGVRYLFGTDKEFRIYVTKED